MSGQAAYPAQAPPTEAANPGTITESERLKLGNITMILALSILWQTSVFIISGVGRGLEAFLVVLVVQVGFLIWFQAQAGHFDFVFRLPASLR